MDSNIYILKGIPLDNRYVNTLSWENEAAQYNYFYNNRSYIMRDGSYVRSQNIFRAAAKYDDLEGCNYLMYQNENKWYYAFITDIKYINDNTSHVEFEIDVMQTWYFDYELKSCFIEREHVENDSIGANTVPEGIEFGDYIVNIEYNAWNFNTQDYIVIVGSTVNLATLESDAPIMKDSNYINGWRYFGFELAGATNLISEIVGNLTAENKIDAIKSIFLFPRYFTRPDPDYQGGTSQYFLGALLWNGAPASMAVGQPDIIDGYVPRNNKLKCYPYNVLTVSNNQGQAIDYRFENFTNNEAQLIANCTLSESAKTILTPVNYGSSMSLGADKTFYDYGVTLPSMPLGGWSNDLYSAWFSQNGATWAVGTAAQILTLGASVASGNILGATIGLSGVVNSMQQVSNALTQPPSSQGNSGNGSTLLATNKYWFTVQNKTVKVEYARQLDLFFDMFGYKVNTVKVPNIRSRPNWNYIKTINCTISGNVTPPYYRKICDIYDSGITFWHSQDVGNYSLNNTTGG